MADSDRTTHDLDRLLADARARPAAPAPELTARVLADAALVQAELRRRPATPAARPAGPWRQLAEALGGWPGLGGLAMAGAAGVWLGFAPPGGLPDPVTFVQDRVAAADVDLLGSAALALALAEETAP